MQGRVLAMADTGTQIPLALSLGVCRGGCSHLTALAALAGGYITLDEAISDLGGLAR